MMDRKRLLKHLVFLVFFIFIANLLAQQFYWYFSIWYFDMFMHFLGGFWVGLVFLWFFSRESTSLEPFLQLIFKVIFAVLMVGILWEIFEISIDKIIIQNPFNALDTFSDIFFDLTGGLVAVLYFFKKWRNK